MYDKFFVIYKMEQKLNIKLLEEQNGNLKAVDSTTIPADSYNKINRAFIEFVIRDNSIIFNIVKEVANASDFPLPTIINIDKDGLYKYYKIVIPTLDFYKAGDLSYTVVTDNIPRCFYYNKNLYKPKNGVTTITLDTLEINCTKIESVKDLWETRLTDNNILYYSANYFSIYWLKNCYINNFNNSLIDLINRGCDIYCKTDSDITTKRDFIFITMYVLNWLINNKEFDEAFRILSIVITCDPYLCNETDSFNNLGGCNCGKS